ncbi:MAG: hypothetical protein HW416_2819 [Chloroflexi bacterium]|nr:hypothetical protein [Chloroflexota bacterium]
MTATDDDAYALGEEVTAVASAKAKSATAVLSVRLTVQEVAEIEEVCRVNGQSLSQVVRDSLLKALAE